MKERVGFCEDCGHVDLLDEAGVCSSCATERDLDLDERYREMARQELADWEGSRGVGL